MENPESYDPKFVSKLAAEGYRVSMNIICAGEDSIETRSAV